MNDPIGFAPVDDGVILIAAQCDCETAAGLCMITVLGDQTAGQGEDNEGGERRDRVQG